MPVGTTLNRLRRERGKTLADIERSTRIMGRMLSALENERWDELPAPVYVKGYIQNYASALGVDPKPLLEEYARDTASHGEHVPARRIPQTPVVPHHLDMHQLPRRAWIAIAVAIVVIALLVWVLSTLVGRDEEPPPIPPETTSTTSPPTGSLQQAPGDEFLLTVGVNAGSSSWLQVTVDSYLAYEGTMTAHEQGWTVSDRAVVRAERPSAVTITRDGQPIALPDAEGIAEVTIAAAE